MVIGICTVHYAHNYGAMLQGYALKTYIEGLGHEVTMVDRRRKKLTKWAPRSLKGAPVKSILLYPKYLAKWYLPSFLPLVKREKVFESFLEQYLNKEPLLRNKQFDCLIFGSDQIWSKFRFGFDKVWWGIPFEGVKKISYATSMGIVDINKEDEPFIKNALSSFSSISVREEELRTELMQRGLVPLKRVERVIDPVFLLGVSNWESLIPKRLVQKPYLLFYDFQLDNSTTELVNRIAANKRLEIVRITNGIVKNNSMRYFPYAGPREFLSLVFYSDFVVSSSFHGVAFSIIFKKQFFARQIWNKERVLDLLRTLDLSSRFVDDIEKVNLNEMIDYSRVRSPLKNEIDKAMHYLDRSLNE